MTSQPKNQRDACYKYVSFKSMSDEWYSVNRTLVSAIRIVSASDEHSVSCVFFKFLQSNTIRAVSKRIKLPRTPITIATCLAAVNLEVSILSLCTLCISLFSTCSVLDRLVSLLSDGFCNCTCSLGVVGDGSFSKE